MSALWHAILSMFHRGALSELLHFLLSFCLLFFTEMHEVSVPFEGSRCHKLLATIFTLKDFMYHLINAFQ